MARRFPELKRNNSNTIRPYGNIVNQDMFDTVDAFPLVECIPEIHAGAGKEVGSGLPQPKRPVCHTIKGSRADIPSSKTNHGASARLPSQRFQRRAPG